MSGHILTQNTSLNQSEKIFTEHHWFRKILSIYHMPGTVLSSGDKNCWNKVDMSFIPWTSDNLILLYTFRQWDLCVLKWENSTNLKSSFLLRYVCTLCSNEEKNTYFTTHILNGIWSNEENHFFTFAKSEKKKSLNILIKY